MIISGRTLALLLLPVALLGCAEGELPEFSPLDPRQQRFRDRYGTITGGDISLLSSRRAEEQQPGGGGIGVNAYLWRGALETVSFLPLASADPFGGLIISDWYQSVDAPGERLRLQILIRDAVLRADGVKVTVLRQVQDPRGQWLDAPVDPETGAILEDKILTRARELRVGGITS
jgi:hypothetical protein